MVTQTYAQHTAGAALTGTEIIPMYQGGATARTTAAAIAALAAGGAVTTWQTVTPNASNAVPIPINFANGPNVHLGAPVDNTQVVQVPTNMPDGAEMEIDMTGGAGSGVWTPWSSGAPATPGYIGAFPTADASAAFHTPIIVKRDGAKYRITPLAARAT